MTKIYLITGFLGAGKTTFLNHQLSLTNKKVGVLMNEFGKISMDSIAVKKNDIDLMELKNGSIFCACLKDKFIDGLEMLVKTNLDEIFIEGSGLADPSDMGKVVEVLTKTVGPGLFEFVGTICLVDGLYFEAELAKMVSVERQIKHSHCVLINKTDLINEEKLAKIVDKIKTINPEVGIIPIQHGVIAFDDLNLKYYDIEDEETTNTVDNKPKNIVIKFKYEPEIDQLRTFLQHMSSHFFRIKGFVKMKSQWYKVDLVNDQIDIIDYQVSAEDEENQGYNELVCLSSQGINSISHLATTAEKDLAMLYTIEM